MDGGMASRWVTEKEVTLDVALRVRALLRARGVNVIMTRDRDTQLSVNKTTDLEARSRMAKADRVNAYVSIHVNAAGPTAQGIETYYFGRPLESRNRTLAVRENGGGTLGENLTRQATSTAQNLLGDLIAQAKIAFSKQLATRVQSHLIAATGAVNRGVQQEAFYVIRNPTTPAILIEIGFGSHPVEGAKLAQGAYRDRLADAIADGICDFLNVK
ncbi:cell wall hydrolase/autolysin [Deinococcus maricopensis DSM 21211]|uniref:Cell wall hydrolase/autolysin n=1 Tax=Deinococcus maricopensis (strain DSM 21211 / LMG 22137 / NRRL B-23946 / LB-34) TaxID=709986 RepID=E8U8E0_DEIML|nr:cell wall hydrolase/autolysin [Deinococcus maricopensis DSM 21211]